MGLTWITLGKWSRTKAWSMLERQMDRATQGKERNTKTVRDRRFGKELTFFRTGSRNLGGCEWVKKRGFADSNMSAYEVPENNDYKRYQGTICTPVENRIKHKKKTANIRELLLVFQSLHSPKSELFFKHIKTNPMCPISHPMCQCVLFLSTIHNPL